MPLPVVFQVGTKPKVVITRLTVFMSLSKYTAPRIASTVADIVIRETTPRDDGLWMTKATRPVARPILSRLGLPATCCRIWSKRTGWKSAYKPKGSYLVWLLSPRASSPSCHASASARSRTLSPRTAKRLFPSTSLRLPMT